MKANSWFKHNNCASFDERMTKLIEKEKSKGYGAYWYIVEMICLQPHTKVSFEYLKNIKRPGFSQQYMRRIITQYGLFKIEDGYFSSIIPYGMQDVAGQSPKQQNDSIVPEQTENAGKGVGKTVQNTSEAEPDNDDVLLKNEQKPNNFLLKNEQVLNENQPENESFPQISNVPESKHNILNKKKLRLSGKKNKPYVRARAGRTDKKRRDKNEIRITTAEKKERKDAAAVAMTSATVVAVITTDDKLHSAGVANVPAAVHKLPFSGKGSAFFDDEQDVSCKSKTSPDDEQCFSGKGSAFFDDEQDVSCKSNTSPGDKQCFSGYLILKPNGEKRFIPSPAPLHFRQRETDYYAPQPYAQSSRMAYRGSGGYAATYGQTYGMRCQSYDDQKKNHANAPCDQQGSILELATSGVKKIEIRPWQELVDELHEDSTWVENACMKCGYGLLLKRYFKEAVEVFRKHIELYDKGGELLQSRDVKQYFANFTAPCQRTSKALKAYLLSLDAKRTDSPEEDYRFEQLIDGQRTYGGQPIPHDAPPRPNASSIWNEETRQWVTLSQSARS